MAPLYFDCLTDNSKLALSKEPIQSHQDPLNKHVVKPAVRYFLSVKVGNIQEIWSPAAAG